MNDVDMYVHKRQQQQKLLRVIVFICPCNALMQWMLHLVIRRRPVESKKSQQLKMINKLLDKNSFFFLWWMGSVLFIRLNLCVGWREIDVATTNTKILIRRNLVLFCFSHQLCR